METDERIRKPVQQIDSRDFDDVKQKVDKIYYAMVGGEINNDGGIVGQLKELKKRISEQDKEIQGLKDRNIKFDIYQRIMWTGIGSVITSFITFIIMFVIKK